MDILKQGVSYDFRVIGVNDYGYGTPSPNSPSISGELSCVCCSAIAENVFFNIHEFSNFLFFHPAQKVAPFYEEWWFLVVVALVGLIFILLLVFILIIRGQSKKYAKKSESGECTPAAQFNGALIIEAVYSVPPSGGTEGKESDDLTLSYRTVTLHEEDLMTCGVSNTERWTWS